MLFLSLDTQLITGVTFNPPSLGVSTEDVFLMSSKDPKNPVIYAVFTTSRYLPVVMVTQLSQVFGGGKKNMLILHFEA